jgi:hypothetical protein
MAGAGAGLALADVTAGENGSFRVRKLLQDPAGERTAPNMPCTKDALCCAHRQLHAFMCGKQVPAYSTCMPALTPNIPCTEGRAMLCAHAIADICGDQVPTCNTRIPACRNCYITCMPCAHAIADICGEQVPTCNTHIMQVM